MEGAVPMECPDVDQQQRIARLRSILRGHWIDLLYADHKRLKAGEFGALFEQLVRRLRRRVHWVMALGALLVGMALWSPGSRFPSARLVTWALLLGWTMSRLRTVQRLRSEWAPDAAEAVA